MYIVQMSIDMIKARENAIKTDFLQKDRFCIWFFFKDINVYFLTTAEKFASKHPKKN